MHAGRGITFAQGFSAGAAKAGVKHGAPERLDVALVVSDRPCAAAAVFTTNQVIAAPCVVTRRHVERGALRAIVVNSGNANACTGEQGERDAIAMAEAAARSAGCAVHEVAVASTGVIGFRLPVERISAALPSIALSASGWDDASRAIMTTDTRPKVAEREIHLAGGTVRIGGMAKGAGMIHPNMATLLAFVTTDAAIDAVELRRITTHAADVTFNAISVDGDTSTNDTLLVLANGASRVAPKGSELAAFADALRGVCHDLARMIVADGEVIIGFDRPRLDALARRRARPTLGLRITNAPAGGRPGVYIDSMRAGSPAERAGLRPGDIITAIDGQPLPSADDLERWLSEHRGAARMALTVARAGGEQIVIVRLR